ncbi:MAG: transposase [bacterium]|nr:transposase [bacterium]
MPRERFVIDNYYHVYNRGVEKLPIFTNDNDRKRFVKALYLLNDTNVGSVHLSRLDEHIISRKNRNPLVSVVSWCLMPNHFHLLLQQRVEGGISKFMQRLGIAYSMYFNTRYERSGVLFQGVFKSRAVMDETYFTHLSRYIHLNPLELRYKNWEKNGVSDIDDAWDFLVNYHWSSLSAYLSDKKGGEQFFSKIIDEPSILFRLFENNPKQYKLFIENWIKKGLQGFDGNMFGTVKTKSRQ